DHKDQARARRCHHGSARHRRHRRDRRGRQTRAGGARRLRRSSGRFDRRRWELPGDRCADGRRPELQARVLWAGGRRHAGAHPPRPARRERRHQRVPVLESRQRAGRDAALPAAARDDRGHDHGRRRHRPDRAGHRAGRDRRARARDPRRRDVRQRAQHEVPGRRGPQQAARRLARARRQV
ncbi:MAG: hypothetical protein AVDCRST_MAG67-3251, partial [uncultured Solirubrobacteraceae bacterium]